MKELRRLAKKHGYALEKIEYEKRKLEKCT